MNASFGDRSEQDEPDRPQDVLDGTGSTSFSADVSGLDFDVTFGVLRPRATTDITAARNCDRRLGQRSPTPGELHRRDQRPAARQVVRTRPTTASARSRRSRRRVTCASAGTGSGGVRVVDGPADRSSSRSTAAARDRGDSLAVTGSVALTGKSVSSSRGRRRRCREHVRAGHRLRHLEPTTRSRRPCRHQHRRPSRSTPTAHRRRGDAREHDRRRRPALPRDDAHLDAVCNLKATAGPASPRASTAPKPHPATSP